MGVANGSAMGMIGRAPTMGIEWNDNSRNEDGSIDTISIAALWMTLTIQTYCFGIGSLMIEPWIKITFSEASTSNNTDSLKDTRSCCSLTRASLERHSITPDHDSYAKFPCVAGHNCITFHVC
jgi:hypothetical protein